ncbi:DUF6232 family protein [Actinoplanes sp. NPDC049596]|uniref:DUF6232 family protein n=1 Tax=unclassified Actinoplanes TaxID=2626549 RepID=UPI003440D92D
MTRIYYRGADAFVSGDQIMWLTTPVRTFAARELRDIRVFQASSSASAATRWTAWATLAAAAAGVGIAVVVDSTWMWVVSAAVDVLAVVWVWRAFVRRTPVWEIHATYRGSGVLLYASTDERVFHQVQRALRRSIEGQPAS